jgi:VWFA-related protein
MKRTLRFVLVTLCLASLSLANAQAAVQVRLISPTPDQPIFGPTEIEVAVGGSEAVARVEVFVNGRSVGVLQKAPYKLTFDAGQANVKRQFRVVAQGASGATASDAIETQPLQIDDRVDLELQQLYVTVIRDRQRVTTLGPADFEIWDNGDRQRIETFDRGELPLSAVLLLDSSESMRGEKITAALEGARAFVDGMRELDQASVLLFSDRMLRFTPFTSDREELSKALASVDAAGGSAVNDHLYAALKMLEGRAGRRVVILLSDGADIHSVLPMRHVLRQASASQALIYWITLDDGKPHRSFNSSWRNFEANDQEFEDLNKAVDKSGGRIVPIPNASEFRAAFGSILQELREQYALGYYCTTNKNDGSWHKVDLRVKGFGLRVRARDGYIDY